MNHITDTFTENRGMFWTVANLVADENQILHPCIKLPKSMGYPNYHMHTVTVEHFCPDSGHFLKNCLKKLDFLLKYIRCSSELWVWRYPPTAYIVLWTRNTFRNCVYVCLLLHGFIWTNTGSRTHAFWTLILGLEGVCMTESPVYVGHCTVVTNKHYSTNTV